MATLSINNVRKQYGAVEVLKGIDLTLADGEFLVLLGPSGCGKSTLLNMIAGLETISAGEIRIDQRVVNGVHPKDRDIAMVFQSYALYPNMTVARNIGFSLEMRGQSKAERDTAVRRVAKLLQIEHLLDRKPAQLSGGQRQRVAMGRALVRDPKIFLFDEPLSNLDAKLRVDMRTEIKKLHQRLGTTVVYVTHDQIEAMTLASRIAIMKEGVVQQFAPPQEVYERPANMYVAGFIGSPTMNFVRGTLSAEGDRLGVSVGRDRGLFLPLPETPDQAPDQAGHWLGQEVILGIRPEAVTCHDPAAAAGNPALARVSCRVDVLEPTGADTITYIQLNGQEVVARIKPSDRVTEGATADFMIDMARANLFDPKTEQRI
ncbi:ABC transporter ATP-binding protein [Azospirillum picis]|uniref:Multiple sugar transport system ATP-binding protein n=1 Tax=Azospirillum picis TaxID=488438 RepID=A0ABU0MMW9_9PROT|nr:sn-glycerol-3-phosphate ABC transporter ATP-binding protein UgpC [Azospirillum picis]MBP2301227.1 multiple sugar transport system ATP-binding protein [Azospirillum picis]MDQ0534810.1 multiple sugar transport system ATP-binding protein [Azospirillum picis]